MNCWQRHKGVVLRFVLGAALPNPQRPEVGKFQMASLDRRTLNPHPSVARLEKQREPLLV